MFLVDVEHMFENYGDLFYIRANKSMHDLLLPCVHGTRVFEEQKFTQKRGDLKMKWRLICYSARLFLPVGIWLKLGVKHQVGSV